MDAIASFDPSAEFEHLSNSVLENTLTQHTANLNAATYKQLILIAEFDRRRAWGHEGLRSCAHWLNFRCGIAIGAAREKIRVGHALAHLPQTRAAFESGALSYSKARALTRVATEHNESSLLNIARYGTANHLEKVVQLHRKQYQKAGCSHIDYHDEVLSAPAGTTFSVADAERQCAAHNHDHRRLDTYWDEYGCLILRARLTPEHGAVVLKAIEAAVETLELDQIPTEDVSAETSRLNTCVKPRHTGNRRADALVSMAESLLEHRTSSSSCSDRYQVVVHVDKQVLAQEIESKNDGNPDCFIENESALPVATVRRISCDCKVLASLHDGGEPLSIGRRSRTIPAAIGRALKIRDGVCQFPGCHCSKHLQAHHIVHWANGGETSLENLVELCHFHHTLLHEGGYSLWRQNNELLFFKPDGTPLSAHPPVLETEKEIVGDCNDTWCWDGSRLDYSMALQSLDVLTRRGAGHDLSTMNQSKN